MLHTLPSLASNQMKFDMVPPQLHRHLENDLAEERSHKRILARGFRMPRIARREFLVFPRERIVGQHLMASVR